MDRQAPEVRIRVTVRCECSRWQPEGVRGPSRVVDTARSRSRRGPASRSTSSSSTSSTSARSRPRGRSTASIPRLAGLRELGVTAIELMPVPTFPGDRGWGYDGALRLRAAPGLRRAATGLARLVDAAHREGSASCSTSSTTTSAPATRRSRAFGPYFTDRFGETPGATALDYSQAGRARVGDPERRALGARLRDRRAAPRRRPRRLGRLAAARPRRARRPGAGREPAGARDQRDGAGRLPPAARLGPRRDVARRASTTRCTSR